VDSDCIEITAGHLCPGSCNCGGATIAASANGRYEALTGGLAFVGCPCAVPPRPKCFRNQCINCGYEPNPPPGCGDGG
jgi:hypothetical protein